MGSYPDSRRSAARVLIFYDRPEIFLPRLAERFPSVEFSVCRSYAQLPAELLEAKPEIVLAYKFEPKPFPRVELLSCESLEWLSVAFAGVDVIVPWDDTRLIVTNASGVAATEMAHYALAAILGMFQGFPALFAEQVAKRWKYRVIRSARNATVGVVGLGRSGREVARMARAVGLKVVGCRMKPEPCADVDVIYSMSQLHQMLGAVDVTVLCVPLTPLTRDLFGESAFKAMRPGSYFVNIARGLIVQEDALITALQTGQLAAAVIDVARTEPLPPSSPLWNAPNLLITPHTSSEYDGWVSDAAWMFADNLERWMTDRSLENTVRPERGY
jgi:phosphoglycerate dehydrogenase-like enzyme